jgi:VanZ family protein
MTYFRWATLVWVFATLLILGIPSGAVPRSGIPNADKITHALIFACGSFLALRGWPSRRAAVVSLVSLFALLAELWQVVLPTHRHADSMDTLANIAGVLLGVSIALLIPWGRRSDS